MKLYLDVKLENGEEIPVRINSHSSDCIIRGVDFGVNYLSETYICLFTGKVYHDRVKISEVDVNKIIVATTYSLYEHTVEKSEVLRELQKKTLSDEEESIWNNTVNELYNINKAGVISLDEDIIDIVSNNN